MKINWKGSALLSPLPAVLVSCASADGAVRNVMTAAWCGVLCTHPALTYIALRPARYSYGLISESREFVINLPTAAMARSVDFCGVYTGKKVDKFARCHLTAAPSNAVKAPSVAECPVSLECVLKTPDGVASNPLPVSFGADVRGTHDLFFAEIVSAAIDERLLDHAGKLHLEKADLLAYCHGEYFGLGKRLGTFGFSTK